MSLVRTDPEGVDVELIKVARANNKEYIGWRDTGAQVSLVKGTMVQTCYLTKKWSFWQREARRVLYL